MRYWGATGIYAESFAALVDREAGGIRADVLARSLRDLGWQAHSLAGDPALVRRSLEQRHPPITLIEDRPGRFHYVVIVGWSQGRVLLHDPARAPFRLMDEERFVQAWSRSGNWMLLALPKADHDASAGVRAAPAVAPPATPCGGLIAQGVALAQAAEAAEARQLLEVAAQRCPAEGAVWRELAGVQAIQKDWAGAAVSARAALRRDPGDAHAARILATSLYLEGDHAGALEAWNVAGEPAIDHVEILGLERTRFSVAAAALGLETRTRLTAARVVRAGRRLEALPAVSGARVGYTPRSGGLAQVAAAVVERPLVPRSRVHLAAAGVRAAIDREVRALVSSPTGAGEAIVASWRWWESRPAFTAGIAVPVAFGVWRVEGFGERESFGARGAEFQESRRGVAVGISDWASSAMRWDLALTAERWSDGAAAGILGGLELRFADERGHAVHQSGFRTGRSRWWSMDAAVEWRTRTRHDGTVWLGRGGVSAVGGAAPLRLWPGAGTGQGRPELLRAHPLLDEGVIRGGVFGRRLVHGSAELRRWIPARGGLLRVAPAGFVDVARALDPPPFADGRAQADAGAGVRIAVSGVGVVRADVAYGLRDGRRAVSVGWTR